MSAGAALSPSPPPVLTDADLRAGCERDLARLEAVTQAATELALEIQRRTMAAMREEEVIQAVPSRAVIAFNRVARVQRQTALLSARLRRELRAWDRPPPADAARQPREIEDRIETAMHRLAHGEAQADHQVERLCAEAEERLEREAFDPALTRSVDKQIMALNEQLDFARRLAGLEPDDAARDVAPTAGDPPAPANTPSNRREPKASFPPHGASP